MSGLCIAVAVAGAVHVFPGQRLTLAWTHSVEHVRWEEDYAIRGKALAIEAARVRSSGAGMEPPPEARFQGGWWHYVPSLPPLDKVVLANSRHVAGYTVCWPGGGCRPLRELVPVGEPATLHARPCAGEERHG